MVCNPKTVFFTILVGLKLGRIIGETAYNPEFFRYYN